MYGLNRVAFKGNVNIYYHFKVLIGDKKRTKSRTGICFDVTWLILSNTHQAHCVRLVLDLKEFAM